MSIRQGKKLIASSITNGFSLFDCKWADHILNNISWLRADTFSWQSGDVYVAAYNHLAGDLGEVEILYCWGSESYTKTPNPSKGDATYKSDGSEYLLGSIEYVADDYSYIATGAAPLYRDSSKDLQLPKEKSPQTDTISDILIIYYLADDGHKICASDQESNISALYAKTGAADYFILDTINKQFKLPRKQKRALIQAVKNTDSTWYNLYSDGWVEQGGKVGTLNNSRITVTLPVTMASSSYTVIATGQNDSSASNYAVAIIAPSTTQIIVASTANYGAGATWQVSGYAAESAYASAGMQFEYYYVGNFEQSAVEQTAGINAETLNGKADTDLGNVPDNVDFVVEWQRPTSANNYTWYRKYKSGWVEQGGRVPLTSGNGTTYVATVVMPITMADTTYSITTTAMAVSSAMLTSSTNATRRVAGMLGAAVHMDSLTTTQFNVSKNDSSETIVFWVVCGFAA